MQRYLIPYQYFRTLCFKALTSLFPHLILIHYPRIHLGYYTQPRSFMALATRSTATR
jgi:hypothetical protein